MHYVMLSHARRRVRPVTVLQCQIRTFTERGDSTTRCSAMPQQMPQQMHSVSEVAKHRKMMLTRLRATFRLSNKDITHRTLSKAFKLADTTEDGYLDLDEVRAMVTTCELLKDLPEHEKEAFAQDMLLRMDLNNDGVIGLSEFEACLRAMTRKVDPSVLYDTRGPMAEWKQWLRGDSTDGLQFNQPRFWSRVFSGFELNAMTSDELSASFKRADRNDDGYLHPDDVLILIDRCSALSSLTVDERQELANEIVTEMDNDDDGMIGFEEFEATLRRLGQTLDPRLWPASFANVMSGLTMSLIVGALPILQVNLALTSADLGCVVGILALSGLLSNLPSTCLSDSYGRRWLIVRGSLLCGVSMLSVVVSDSMLGLLAGRVVGGMGITFLSTGVAMFCNDVSTPLNRARSIVPIQGGYIIGGAMGPVLSGVLIQYIGLETTFIGAAACYVALAAVTRVAANETHPPQQGVGIMDTVREQLAWWPILLRDQEIRHMAGTAFGYYTAMGGAQLTVLPLMLAECPYLLTPGGAASIFGISTMVMVASLPFVGPILDKQPKPVVTMGAATLMGLGLFGAPYVPEVAAALDVSPALGIGFLLGAWSLGGNFLYNAPMAWVPDIAKGASQAPAVALCFCAMDLGFLSGSVGAGSLALYLEKPVLIQGVGAGLLAWGAWVQLWYLRRKRLAGR